MSYDSKQIVGTFVRKTKDDLQYVDLNVHFSNTYSVLPSLPNIFTFVIVK